MNNKKHLQRMQMEKQRFEWATKQQTEWQYKSFKFSIEYKSKGRNKLVVLVIAAIASIAFAQWNIITDIIGAL